MMDCKWAEDRVVDYLYDELSAEEREAFEQHLAQCPEHAREIEATRRLLSLVREEDAELRQQAPALEQAIWTAAKAQRRANKDDRNQIIRPGFWRRWAWSPTALAAAVAMILVAVGLSVALRMSAEPDLLTRQALPAAQEPMAPVRPALAPSAEELKEDKKDQEEKSPGLVTGEALDHLEFKKGLREEAPVSKPRARRAKKSKRAAERPTAKPGPAQAAPKSTSRPAEPSDRKRESEQDDQAQGRSRGKLGSLPDRDALSFAQPPAPKAARSLETAKADDVPADDVPADEAQAAGTRAEGEPRPSEQAATRSMSRATSRSEAPGPDTLFEQAHQLFVKGRCQAAIVKAQEALRLAPRHRLAAETLFESASCHVKLGRFAQARAIYRRIEQEFPERAAEARRARERIGR